MRLKSIFAKDIPPVKTFEVEGLSDLVVIAGQNGIGKTRLVTQLIAAFQNPSIPNVQFIIEATSSDERTYFAARKPEGAEKIYEIDTNQPIDAQKLTQLLQQNKRRRNYKSGVLYYESDRTIVNVQPLKYQFEYPDPWEEPIAWSIPSGGLKNRWQDTQHAIFKKIHSQGSSITARARQLRKEGRTSMNLTFEDPLLPFKEAFAKLLGPKELVDINLQNQRLMYRHEGQERDILTLSSGEKEVLNIAFDFILRKPSDCIIFFDEPELHLHPELLSRLISTLRSVGSNNQFILISHSPEVISSTLNDTVVFLTPPNEDNRNQAVIIGRDDEATEALHLLGQAVGVVALGKKIVLIEGEDASLDKLTYSQLLENRFPNLVLLPSGGKDNLRSFSVLGEKILNRSIWGVKFYMLADRDAVSGSDNSNKNFKTLSRYHLENYFLDGDILAECFSDMVTEDSWLRQPKEIEKKLKSFAGDTLSYAASLIASKRIRNSVGHVNLMPKGSHKFTKEKLVSAFEDNATKEMLRVEGALEVDSTKEIISEIYDELSSVLSLNNNDWKVDFPAKTIFSKFCEAADIKEGRLKSMYLAKAKNRGDEPFAELISIFEEFSQDT